MRPAAAPPMRRGAIDRGAGGGAYYGSAGGGGGIGGIGGGAEGGYNGYGIALSPMQNDLLALGVKADGEEGYNMHEIPMVDGEWYTQCGLNDTCYLLSGKRPFQRYSMEVKLDQARVPSFLHFALGISRKRPPQICKFV